MVKNGKDHKVKYDLDNRIIKVDIDNTDVKYRYDALGRRVIREQKSVTKTALIWWGNSECAEYKYNSAIQHDLFSHPTRLNEIIENTWGKKFKLCCDCTKCPKGLKIHIKISESNTGYPVNIYSIKEINSTQAAWNMDQGEIVAAHEIVHFLGNIDECGKIGKVNWNRGSKNEGVYAGATGNKDYGRPNTVGGNIMNNQNGEAELIHAWYIKHHVQHNSTLISNCKTVKYDEKCN